MLPRSSTSLSFQTLETESCRRCSVSSSVRLFTGIRTSGDAPPSPLRWFYENVNCSFALKAPTETHTLPLLFHPPEELKKELLFVSNLPRESIGRQKYSDDCEDAVNEQIDVEYVSYVYHAMYAYFDRNNVALKGLTKIFKDSREEEIRHADKLNYQIEKGDALYATETTNPVMELALALEKLANEELLNLHNVADQRHHVQLTDFMVEAIKKLSEYVSQLRRVGKGHGAWDFDQKLVAGRTAV